MEKGGGLYSFNLAGGPVDVLLNNETNSCSEVKRVASFKNILAFTDSGAYQVKVYDSVDKVVTVLVGSDQKGNKDGTTKVALLFNRKESALLGKNICDVRGNRELKLITELSGTTQLSNQISNINS